MGFRPNIGTRDALTTIKRAIKQILKTEKGFNILFVDFSKAFDTITRRWINLALKEHHVPENLIKMKNEIYDAFTTNIRISKDGETARSPDIPINNGVLQGDILSPSLFILGLDSIIRRLPKNRDKKQLLEIFAYADDIAFICASIAEAKRKIEALQDLEVYTGLKISIPKTKVMHLDKEKRKLEPTYEQVAEQNFPFECKLCPKKGFFTKAQLTKHEKICDGTHKIYTKSSKAYKIIKEQLNQEAMNQQHPKLDSYGQEIEAVSKFKYLGNMITYDDNIQTTIQHRIQIGKTYYRRLYKIFRHMNYKTQKRIIKATVVLMAIFGSESWPLDSYRCKTELNNFSLYIKNSLIATKNKNVPYKHKLANKDIDILAMCEKRLRKYQIKLKTLSKKDTIMKKNHPAIRSQTEPYIENPSSPIIQDQEDQETSGILQAGGFYEQARKYKEKLEQEEPRPPNYPPDHIPMTFRPLIMKR